MRFLPTTVAGAHLIELERRGDARGFFARFFCEREFADAGLVSHYPQMNNSLTAQRGTLRGLHYQLPPAAEAKVVRCVRGAFWDVVADLRPNSPTYRRWFGARLDTEDRHMMYVPPGCAHGFVTLTDDAEALYLSGAAYSPEHERGVRYDDPWLGIEWPVTPTEMSDKDRSWPSFDPEFHGVERMRDLLPRRLPEGEMV